METMRQINEADRWALQEILHMSSTEELLAIKKYVQKIIDNRTRDTELQYGE